MSLDQLSAVVTIAEEGTVMRAARRLHISQPPLTRKLAALEDELGVRLFERSARGMTLTPVGETFVAEAAAILAAVGRAATIGRREAASEGPPTPLSAAPSPPPLQAPEAARGSRGGPRPARGG